MKNKSPRRAQAAEFSITVSRALGILSMFSPERPQLSLAQISRDARLSKPSVLRFMQALIRHGFVEQDAATRQYRPGFEIFRVGSLFSRWGLRPAALPLMRAVTAETGFTSYLSTLRGDRMVIVASVEGSGPLRFSVPVGETIPLHSTSTGQAALATLKDDEIVELLKRTGVPRKTAAAPGSITQLLVRLREVRADRYAVSWEMTSPGVGSVASAVVDSDAKLAGVLTLGFGTGQVEKAACARLGARILAAAQDLSIALGPSTGLLAA